MNEQNTASVSDEEKVKDAKKKNKNEHDQIMSDYRDVLKTPAGIRLFKHIIIKGRLFHGAFTGNSTVYFNEGRRNLICEIIKEIDEADQDKLPKLIFEV